MFKKFLAFKESLKDDVTFNKKEYVLTLTVCILGGILFGMIFTPKKTLNIGSFNASNGYDPYGFRDMTEEDEEDNRS